MKIFILRNSFKEEKGISDQLLHIILVCTFPKGILMIWYMIKLHRLSKRKIISFFVKKKNSPKLRYWHSGKQGTQFHYFLFPPPGYLTLPEKATESCQLDSLQIWFLSSTTPSTLKLWWHPCLSEKVAKIQLKILLALTICSP